MLKVGIRQANIPNNEEKAILIDHILTEFSGHTCAEIKVAFEMAIAGKLEDIDSKGNVSTLDATCYENFSCLYFSKIMNSYRSWAKEAYNNLPNKDLFLIEDKKELTDDDMNEWIEEWKGKVKTIQNPIMIPPLFYDWLTEKGELVLTKKQKIEYATVYAVSLRQSLLSEQSMAEGKHGDSNAQLREFNEMKKNGCFVGDEAIRIKDLAKKIAVYHYLNSFNK